jgi:hypothetical protein
MVLSALPVAVGLVGVAATGLGLPREHAMLAAIKMTATMRYNMTTPVMAQAADI